MAVKIELKRSAVPGKIPTTSSLDLGELALNTYDGTAFLKQQQGSVQTIVQLATTAGSGSNVASASFATSASFASTSSFALNFNPSATASYATFAATASIPLLGIITASVAQSTITFTKGDQTTFDIVVSQSGSVQTASYALFAESAGTASIATTSSFALTASYALNVPTQSISSSYAATASYVENAQTASYVLQAVSSSFALSASYAVSASYEIITELSSSYADTASFAFEAISSSFALTASYALNVPTQSVSSSYAATASVAISSSYATTASISNIQYVTNSGNLALGQIQVLDYSDSVATTYVNGLLTFVFGTPVTPSALAASISGFDTNRFNQVTDNYTVLGSWSNGGYSLISASLYEGNTFLTGIVDSGTSLSYNTTTSGSHTYRLAYTASNPLDSSIYMTSTTTTGTVTKTNPSSPSISATPTIQLGATSNQLEQGATGSISFTSASGTGNGWVIVYTTSSVASPYAIVGSLTGSTSIPITATSFYSSSGVNGSDNSPALTTTSTTTTTYSKIRSLRSGATLTSSYNQGELENLGAWDTTLGGVVGTIQKGTTTATGQTCIINWTGSLYQYIVYDSSRAALTAINSSGFNVIGSFTLTTVGSYKVYRTIDLQAGYGGTTQTYTLI